MLSPKHFSLILSGVTSQISSQMTHAEWNNSEMQTAIQSTRIYLLDNKRNVIEFIVAWTTSNQQPTSDFPNKLISIAMFEKIQFVTRVFLHNFSCPFQTNKKIFFWNLFFITCIFSATIFMKVAIKK